MTGEYANWLLCEGARLSDKTLMEDAIKEGAKINARCVHGRTALHNAAHCCQIDSIKFLMENGADPTIPDKDDRTAIDVAAERCFAKGIEMMENWRKSL